MTGDVHPGVTNQCSLVWAVYTFFVHASTFSARIHLSLTVSHIFVLISDLRYHWAVSLLSIVEVCSSGCVLVA